MKTMYSLNELATMLQQQRTGMLDVIVRPDRIGMTPEATVMVPGVEDGSPRSLTGTGHQQLATYTDIPKVYYDRLLATDKPTLAANVNLWLRRKEGEKRMVRMLNGAVRAILSDRYQRIDNMEVAQVTLNVLAGIKGVEVVSSAITEQKMHIKAVSYNVKAEVKGSKQVGDVIAAGCYISNSEVGNGAVSIKPFVERLVCRNGMVRDDGSLRANHVGRRADADLEGLLSDTTRRMEDEVVLRKVKDVVAHAFDQVKLQQFADRAGQAAQQRIEGNVPDVVQVLGPTLGVQVIEQQSVLKHLIEGGDLSRWGLANAITRTAEDMESYDRATELETIGYRLLDLSATAWEKLSRADERVRVAR